MRLSRCASRGSADESLLAWTGAEEEILEEAGGFLLQLKSLITVTADPNTNGTQGGGGWQGKGEGGYKHSHDAAIFAGGGGGGGGFQTQLRYSRLPTPRRRGARVDVLPTKPGHKGFNGDGGGGGGVGEFFARFSL